MMNNRKYQTSNSKDKTALQKQGVKAHVLPPAGDAFNRERPGVMVEGQGS